MAKKTNPFKIAKWEFAGKLTDVSAGKVWFFKLANEYIMLGYSLHIKRLDNGLIVELMPPVNDEQD